MPPPLPPALTAALAAAGDLLLGAVCPGCGVGGLGLCPACRQQVVTAEPGITAPDPTPEGLPLTVCCGPYAPPFSGMITAHKEDNALLLTPILGRLLARSVTGLLDVLGAGAEPVGLTWVPSADAAVRRRGFDATAAMTRAAARWLRRDGRTVRTAGLLRQVRPVPDQAGLSAAERLDNLSGRLAVRGSVRPGWWVLTDDVVTTGASLREAAGVLQGAGFRLLGAATVAATRRHRRPQDGYERGLRTE